MVDLPEPVGPKQSDHLAGLRIDVNVLNNGARPVGERDVLKAHVPADRRHGDGVRSVAHIRNSVKDFKDALACRRAHRQQRHSLAEHANRLDKLAQVGGEGNKLADRSAHRC